MRATLLKLRATLLLLVSVMTFDNRATMHDGVLTGDA